MTFLPIVERELRVTARRRRAFWLRLLAAGVFVALGWMAIAAIRSSGRVASGRSLFWGLTQICWWCCVWWGPLTVADVLSAERRNHTLGLLFLTDLRPLDIALGKAAAALLHALNVVLASLPVFTVALLLGGVTAGEIGRTGVALISTLWLSIGLSLAVSAGCVEGRSAFVLSGFLVGVLTFLAPALPPTLAAVKPFSPGWLLYLARQGTFAFPFFLRSCLAVLALGWGAFAAAAWILQWVSRDRSRPTRAQGRGAWAFRWTYGRRAVRQRLRRRLLDRNPWAWLAGRNLLKRRVLLALLTPLLPAWMIWGEPRDFALTLLVVWLIQFLLKILIASESSQLSSSTRQAGLFELILSTPLTPDQIMQGQRQAVTRTFFWPVLVTALLANLLVLPHFSGWDRLVPPLFTLTILFDFATVNRVALWRGLAARRAYLVVPGVLFRVMFWPTLLFLPLLPSLTAMDSPWLLLFIWAMFFGIGNGLQHSYATGMLRFELRPQVAERFPAAR